MRLREAILSDYWGSQPFDPEPSPAPGPARHWLVYLAVVLVAFGVIGLAFAVLAATSSGG